MPVLSTLGAAIANVYGFTSGLIKDQYFNLVSLLLPGNGTNGAQNNTFLDSSTNNFTITRNGDTTQGTFSPFSQTGWGNYFDGTGDCLSIPTSAISSVGSNDFSMECWVYLLRQTNTLSQGLISYGVSGSTAGTSYISFELTPSGYAAVAFASATALAITSSTITPINQWAHIALCRSGSTLSIFLNGSRVATTSTSATVGSTGNVLFVGSQWYANEATRNLQGYISNARIVNGSSAYDATQSTINVPTLPLTAISNTSLLTCQSNRFKDSSSTPLTVTPSGNTSVTPFSPFAPTSSYSAAAVGGSGYFDGSGDYLTANSAGLELGSNLFTVDGWFYCTGYNGGGAIYSSVNTYPSSTGLLFYVNSTGGYVIDVNGTNIISTGTAPLNTWTHFAIVRSSTGSNGVTLYINGSALTPGTSATNFSSTYAVIGRTGFGAASNYWLGYLSGIRVVVGSANVPSSVPTSPPTAITNTALLLNFTNAGVVDATAKNVLETEGNAQISNGAGGGKWGGGSISFDGTGDWLIAPSNNLASFETGDFSVEMWVYPTSVGGGTERFIFDTRATGTDAGLAIYLSTTGVLSITSSNAVRATAGTVSANTWSHIAVTRASGTLTAYVNGTAGTPASYTSSITCPGRIRVGVKTDDSTPYVGYIDDLRITKGYARTMTTVPTAPFPVQ